MLRHGTLVQSVKLHAPHVITPELGLISPYGGELVNLLVDEQQAHRLRGEALELPSVDLTQQQLCDLELLLNGAFSPLRGYMDQADYVSVLEHMHTANGTFWPLPVVLDVNGQTAAQFAVGDRVALRDPEGFMVAVLTVHDLWQADKEREAQALYGTTDTSHPGVNRLMVQTGSYYMGGSIQGVSLPVRYDYPALRQTPRQLRAYFASCGWARIAAFQAANPLNRMEQEMVQRIAEERALKLLVHPIVAMTHMDDTEYFNRVRCYQKTVSQLPAQNTALALLPLVARGTGLRDVLWHGIIHRNYGCSHFIVEDTFEAGKYAASRQKLDEIHDKVLSYQDILGLEIVPLHNGNSTRDHHMLKLHSEMVHATELQGLPDSEFRHRLIHGMDIPERCSFPQVIDELRRFYPTKDRQGFTVFFTGLSGAGKSTLAKILLVRLMEIGGRQVSLLDGDLVRKHLSNELGFSKEHRDINVRRIGYVTSEITKHRGIALCAPIAPYRATRRAVRQMVEPYGGFFEVYVATPLEVCEQRDSKGLYAKARAGLIKEFTGISDPYEIPEAPEITIDTSRFDPEEAVQNILLRLEKEGYL